MIRYKKIFLGGECNNDCLHCPPAHKNSPPADYRSIEKALKERESDSVVFYGGEPTLRNDLLPLVAEARGEKYRRIKIVTNGRAFSNRHYLDRLMTSGCSLFEISLWGSNQNLHDHLSGAPGSFWETMTGLGNLSEVPHEKFVCIRIPICRENTPDLENTVVTALNSGAHRIVLSLQDRNLPPESLVGHLSNCINISIFNRVWILTEGFPFCCMQGLEQHMSEIYSGWDTIPPRTYRKKRQCSDCTYDKICHGVDSRFVHPVGQRDFPPVKAGGVADRIKALYDS